MARDGGVGFDAGNDEALQQSFMLKGSPHPLYYHLDTSE